MPSLADRVIGSDTLTVDDTGAGTVEIRIPWYRSLAPSTVEVLEVSLDGAVVPQAALAVEINGRSSSLGALAQRWEETWFIQDSALVHLGQLPDLAPEVELSVDLTVRIPYILVGPGAALRRHVRETRRVPVVREGDSR